MALTPEQRLSLIKEKLNGAENAAFLRATLPNNIGHWITLSASENSNLVYVGEGFKPMNGLRQIGNGEIRFRCFRDVIQNAPAHIVRAVNLGITGFYQGINNMRTH